MPWRGAAKIVLTRYHNDALFTSKKYISLAPEEGLDCINISSPHFDPSILFLIIQRENSGDKYRCHAIQTIWSWYKNCQHNSGYWLYGEILDSVYFKVMTKTLMLLWRSICLVLIWYRWSFAFVFSSLITCFVRYYFTINGIQLVISL